MRFGAGAWDKRSMSAHGRIRAGHVERLAVRNDRLEVKALWAYSKGAARGRFGEKMA